mgnify:CR=1 FL=1
MKKIIWIVLFILGSLSTFAQKTALQFTNQINQQLVGMEGSAFYAVANSFIHHLNDNHFDDDVEEKFLKLNVLLRQKKINSKAIYIDLFRLYNSLAEDKISKENFEILQYNIGLDIQDNYFDRAFIVLENTANFLQSGYLYSDGNFKWSCSSTNWNVSDNIYLSISFENTDIQLDAENASFTIQNVEGEYRLDQGIFIGQKGSINWKNYGFPQRKRTTKLGRFEIQTVQPRFYAEDVLLKDTDIAKEEEIAGNIFFNKLNKTGVFQLTFESYSIYPLNNFHPNIEAKTGIKLVNEDFIPFAPKFHKMEFNISNNKQKQVQIAATNFKLIDDVFSVKEGAFKFYFKKDSISHPMIDFKYQMNKGLFHAALPKNPIGKKTPFEDSYHSLHILSNHCFWDESLNQLIFENKEMSQLVPVKYQSLRYFHPDWFLNMFGMEDTHPTSLLKRLSKQNNWARKFDLIEVQEMYKVDANTLHTLMVEFTNHGFIDYDPIQEYIIIKDRFFTFYDGLKKKKDHDQLRIVSNINNRPSGIINLESGILDIYKVKEVNINTQQMTSIYPEDEIIHIHEKMNFSFDGTTICSKFAFFGTEQYFDYDNYSFTFNEIDSIRYLLELPIKDSIHIQPCNTVIQKFTGILEIDRPNNKSSKKELKQYPKLTTETSSFVFYDEVKDGIYPKDKFHYELNPFKINGLKNVNTKELTFEGKLLAGEIFPEIKENLVLNERQELGFKHKIKGKYKLYNVADFNNTLILSNSGLTGLGQMNYNGLSLKCDSVDFYPNYSFADIKTIKSNPLRSHFSIPQLKGENIRMDWFLELGIMELKNKDKFFELYSNQTLNGGLEMTDTALLAYGTIIVDNIVSHSENIHLKQKAWKSSNSKLRIFQNPNLTNYHTDEEIVQQEDAQVIYLTDERKLISGIRNKSSAFQLPINQYQLSMEKMSYISTQNRIHFSTTDTLLIGNYTSLHPYQDSLEIWGNIARLDLFNLELEFEDIKGVRVADALIKPKQDNLQINELGFLDTISNASLQLINKDHQVRYQFQKAKINIYGKEDYQASADFVYTDRLGDQQSVHFEDIHVTENGKSEGSSELTEEDDFYIDPQISFQGTLSINDLHGTMIAEGQTQFHDHCSYLEGPLYQFKDSLNKFNGYLDEQKEEKPFFSLMFNQDNYELYPAFSIHKKDEQDIALLTIEGKLSYDNESNYYSIKGQHTDDHANLNDACEYWMEGYFNLSHSKFISDLSYGTMQMNSDKNESPEIELHFGLNFPIADKALKWMRKDFVRKLKYAEQSDEDQISYINFLRSLIGEEQSQRYFKAKSKGRYFVHPSMRSDLFFTGLKMQWNEELELFEHSEEWISLNHIDGTKVDRMVKGKIQYRPNSEGDYWYFYFEFEEGGYYFMEIDGNIFYTYSSEEKYNRLIQKKSKDLKKKREVFQTSLSPALKR